MQKKNTRLVHINEHNCSSRKQALQYPTYALFTLILHASFMKRHKDVNKTRFFLSFLSFLISAQVLAKKRALTHALSFKFFTPLTLSCHFFLCFGYVLLLDRPVQCNSYSQQKFLFFFEEISFNFHFFWPLHP